MSYVFKPFMQGTDKYILNSIYRQGRGRKNKIGE